jgi:hypothetical protein
MGITIIISGIFLSKHCEQEEEINHSLINQEVE